MILVTGGCRSGKSAFAETLVTRDKTGPWLYVATALITDPEMEARVKKHRQRRGDSWKTWEGFRNLGNVLAGRDISGWEISGFKGILLDSVTTMTTNLLFDFIADVDWEHFQFEQVDYNQAQDYIMDNFKALCQAGKDLPLVMVTDEIGLGVVPETCLGRNFRDILGTVNQYLASECTSVYMVISGIPVRIKGAEEK